MATVARSMKRVENQTRPEDNEKNQATDAGEHCLLTRRMQEQIPERLAELDREWDVERMLQFNSAALSLVGLALARKSPKWLVLPIAVQGFFLQHGIQGWCPPLPLFRRAGIRTAREIEIERHALKALRGDYQQGSERRRVPRLQSCGDKRN